MSGKWMARGLSSALHHESSTGVSDMLYRLLQKGPTVLGAQASSPAVSRLTNKH